MNEFLRAKPIPPSELLLYQILQTRKNLSESEQKDFYNSEIGYLGEVEFFEFLHSVLPEDSLLLHSLQLPFNNSEFQIDSLLILENTIYLFEVKNFSGDFFIQGKNWHVSPSGKEINNPLIQLSRAESLLRQLIHSLGFQFDIQSQVVFVHEEFTLFQAPMTLPILLRSQLNRFFKKVIRGAGIPSNNAIKLAQTLTNHHLEKSSYERLPEYSFDELKKGIFCPKCKKEMQRSGHLSLICKSCSFIEINKNSIMRSVNEFNTLFSNENITINNIYEWTGKVLSKKTIRNNLRKI